MGKSKRIVQKDQRISRDPVSGKILTVELTPARRAAESVCRVIEGLARRLFDEHGTAAQHEFAEIIAEWLTGLMPHTIGEQGA